MKGIINVLKPTGMTSHDVVGFIRRTINMKKVGHTGTLDPNAAGVLPICIGKATKVSQYLLDKRKSYRAELTLGEETDTQDKYGNIINKSEVNVTEDEIYDVFEKFKGDILQVPPMFSALKHKGKKLYELAREGKTIEREPRQITIHELKILDIRENKILFDVNCSKGTYIRTLCNDIGNMLGTYGHMSVLIRTKVDKFDLENSFTLVQIEEAVEKDEFKNILLPMDYALTQYRELVVDDEYYDILSNGGRISFMNIQNEVGNFKIDEKLRIYCMNKFMGIGLINTYMGKKYLKMDKVLL